MWGGLPCIYMRILWKEVFNPIHFKTEAEAKRESMARQNRYIGVLDKFIHEGHEALSSFAKTDRINFNEKESASNTMALWHLL